MSLKPLIAGMSQSTGSNAPSRVVYASQLSGIQLNSNVLTGGGTDDTTVLQTAINAINAAGGGELVINGAAKVSGLTHPSNVIISGKGWNTGFYLANGSDKPVLRNANPTKGTVVDKNLGIRDLTINGNNSNNTVDTTAGTTPFVFGGATAFNDAGDKMLMACRYYGTDRLTVSNVQVIDARLFAFHLCNTYNLRYSGVRAYWNTLMTNHANVQFDGPAIGVRVNDIWGNGEDDVLALNSGELAAQSLTDIYDYIWDGDCSDVIVDGVVMAGNTKGIRIMSSAGLLMDKITIRNVSGTCNNQNSFLIYTNTEVGDLVIDGWNVQGTAPFNPGGEGTFTFDKFIIKNFYKDDGDGTVAYITLNGTGNFFSVENPVAYQATAGSDFINITGGTVQAINLTGASLANFDNAVNNSAGTVVKLNVSGYIGSAVTNVATGTFTTKTGDAEMTATY